MSNITDAELGMLRSKPHSTKLWLSIYKPTTIFACQINDVDITVGAMDIPYDNVTVGAIGDVLTGMTILVGSASGGSDKGRIRLKSAAVGTITTASNSHIEWENDLFLTVVNFWEVWPIYPRFVIDGEEVIQYKDYDVPYSNQNSAGLGTIICMGCHYAGWKEDGVYYTATGTVHVRGEGLSYSWIFGGGVPGSSAVHTPGTVMYPTPGHYRTALTVTSASGTIETSYRHISIYDRPERGTNVPILSWQVKGFSGSRDEGGYSATISIHESVSDLVDGSLVIIFADDIYGRGGVVQSIGGNSENRQTIVFVGYILDGTIRYDYQQSSVEFEVISVSGRMKELPGPSISITSSNNPIVSGIENNESPWFYVEDLDIRKALYHYYKWHSTLLLNTDLRYISTNFVFRDLETDPSSLYDAINNDLMSDILGLLSADRQGNLYAEMGPGAVTGSISLGMTVTKSDWMNEPEIDEIITRPLAYLELGGVAWSGISTGTVEEFIAGAPGNEWDYFGRTEEQDGLILVNQEQLNALAGNMFAYRNARYSNMVMKISGNYRNFDIVPLERQLINLVASDNRRGITLTNEPFHIMDMEWEYDGRRQLLTPTITLHQITDGYDGTTVPRPQTPEDNDPDQPDGDPPEWPIIPDPMPIPIPIIPPIPPWIPQPPPEEDTACYTDINWPPNGPYAMGSRDTLQSNQPNPLEAIYYLYWVRSTDHVYKTTVLIDGCFEQSTDNGVSWQNWDDNDGLHILATSPGITGADFQADMSIVGGATCELRGGYITPDVSKPSDGLYVYLDPAESFVGDVSATIYSSGDTCSGLAACNPGSSTITEAPPRHWTVADGGTWIYTWIVFKMTVLAGAYANGHVQLTVLVHSNINNGDFKMTQVRAADPSYDPTALPVLSDNVSPVGVIPPAGQEKVLPGSGGHTYQTGYFAIRTGPGKSNTGEYFGAFELRKIEWEIHGTSDIVDLYTPLIKRVKINEVYLYNICT